MRFPALAALAILLAAAPSAQPASRLFLVPTARPVAKPVELGARFVIPSVEANLGRGVSAGVTGLVLPRDGGGIRGAGIADVRVSLIDQERVALALGVTGSAEYSSGASHRMVPASAHAYAVGTVGSETASATLGLGVRAQGRPEYEPPPNCPVCDIDPGFFVGEPTYRVRVRSLPVVFGGAEAEVGRNGAFGYRLVAEGLALPVRSDRYTTTVGGGLRITHKAARLDLGAMVVSEAWGLSDRTTQLGPWIGFTAGL